MSTVSDAEPKDIVADQATCTMTHQDFTDAILAEPGDDAPRLIYADWLEERSDPRAEFIRVQVEVATLARPLERKSMYGNPIPQPRDRRDTARFRELFGRQLDLLLTHCAEWVEPLIGKATGVLFERGCIEGFSAQPQTFAKHASLWYRSMPISQLCVSAPSSMKDKDWLSLLRSPHLLNIRTLELGWGIAPAQIAALGECPYVVNLKELLVRYGRLDDDLHQQLRQSPNLKNARF